MHWLFISILKSWSIRQIYCILRSFLLLRTFLRLLSSVYLCFDFWLSLDFRSAATSSVNLRKCLVLSHGSKKQRIIAITVWILGELCKLIVSLHINFRDKCCWCRIFDLMKLMEIKEHQSARIQFFRSSRSRVKRWKWVISFQKVAEMCTQEKSNQGDPWLHKRWGMRLSNKWTITSD